MEMDVTVRYGERISLPLKGEGLWECKKTGDKYSLKGDKMIHIKPA